MSKAQSAPRKLPVNFLSLPGEIRNTIYQLVLLSEKPLIGVLSFPQHLSDHAIGIFRANKAIHKEAASVFYSQNIFNFEDRSPQQANSFLESIGSRNASNIRQIFMNPPALNCLTLGQIAITDRTKEFLNVIEVHCSGVQTVQLTAHREFHMKYDLTKIQDTKIQETALACIDNSLRSIASLKEIIFADYSNRPFAHLRKQMESLGWRYETTEWDWESDESECEYPGCQMFD